MAERPGDASGGAILSVMQAAEGVSLMSLDPRSRSKRPGWGAGVGCVLG